MKRIWTLGTVVMATTLVCGAAGFAWQWRETSALRERFDAVPRDPTAVARLQAEQNRLRAEQVPAAELEKLRADHARAQKLRTDIVNLRARLARIDVGGPAVAGQPRTGRTASAASAAAATRPTTQQLRAKVDERYAALVQQLHLSANQLESLTRLLMERLRVGLEPPGAAMERGRDPNALSVRQEVADAQTRAEAAIRVQLGAAVHAAYEDYEWTLSARNLVGQLERLLAGGAAPLGEKQKTALVDILSRARPKSGAARGYGAVRYRIQITDETLGLAGRVLAAAQMKVFEAFAKSLAGITGP